MSVKPIASEKAQDEAKVNKDSQSSSLGDRAVMKMEDDSTASVISAAAAFEKTSTPREIYQMCIATAEQYIDRGDLLNAKTSFLSDMAKNPTTKKAVDGIAGMILMRTHFDAAALRKYLRGFPI